VADFSSVQKRLNKDPQYKEKFLRDPVAAVKDQGVTPTPEMEQALKKFTEQVVAKKDKPAGSSSTAGINGGIAIGIHF
jgi:hypothetical protein